MTSCHLSAPTIWISCFQREMEAIQDVWASVGVWVSKCVPPCAIKGFWWLPRGSAISAQRQELVSPPIMTSPPQKRVRWSFLNRDGRSKVAGWKGNEDVMQVLPFVEIKGNSWYSIGREHEVGLDWEAAHGLTVSLDATVCSNYIWFITCNTNVIWALLIGPNRIVYSSLSRLLWQDFFQKALRLLLLLCPLGDDSGFMAVEKLTRSLKA